MLYQAILSSTVLPLDGDYRVVTLSETPNIAGVLHYAGHPSTKEILEKAGAIKSPHNLFYGLYVGEQALACSLAQPRQGGNSDVNVETEVTVSDLTWRLITRLA